VNATTNQIYVANPDFGSPGGVTVIDGATNNTTNLTVGVFPGFMVVNPLTDKIYVANNGDDAATSSLSVIDGAVDSTATVAVGTDPDSAAVNPLTNQIYVSNYSGGSVNVIDGATNSTTTVAAGTNPISVAANPVTDKIYVANYNSANVTVISGAGNSTTTVAVGTNPISVSVNPVTNQIYTANYGSNSVTAINGATGATDTVPVGPGPTSVAVNPVTNQIYTANKTGNSVTVINGATNATTTIAVGSNPTCVAVNPATNQIYVANYSSASVTVINGATNATATVAVGSEPVSIAVNPLTNKIYVANQGSANVTVIDGATNSTATISAATKPSSVGVNPVTNKIYVANQGSGDVTVIDGATNTAWTVIAGTNPGSVAVNPVTNQIYVTNSGSGNVTVIDEQRVQSVPLTTTITPLPNNQTSNPAPSFTFTAESTTATVPDGLYFQVDTWRNAWTAATGSNPSFTGTVAPLQPGFHILYAYAVDGQEGAASEEGSPLTGVIQAYGFVVTPAASAQYGGSDTVTQGTWTGVYGMNGEIIANDAHDPPAYATVSVTGDSVYTWAASTSDVRALQTASGSTTRIAATYDSPTSFTINVNLTDGNRHRLALYLLDWDSTARSETISILDATSNAVLSSGTFSGFHNGVYAYWEVQGHVLIQVTKTGGANAVVSGIFFDPIVTASATYSGSDSTTEGTWTGKYGSAGEWIANDLTNTPAFASVSVTGDAVYTWAASTSDVRALQIASGSSNRIASTYYSAGSFTINLDLTDGNTHKISLYLLDWDSTARSETISVLDANSNAVLSSEKFSGFHDGEYAEWEVQGHVLIQVTKTGGANAVVSGIFFD
jgi:YVTN family beta-propeller protein